MSLYLIIYKEETELLFNFVIEDVVSFAFYSCGYDGVKRIYFYPSLISDSVEFILTTVWCRFSPVSLYLPQYDVGFSPVSLSLPLYDVGFSPMSLYLPLYDVGFSQPTRQSARLAWTKAITAWTAKSPENFQLSKWQLCHNVDLYITWKFKLRKEIGQLHIILSVEGITVVIYNLRKYSFLLQLCKVSGTVMLVLAVKPLYYILNISLTEINNCFRFNPSWTLIYNSRWGLFGWKRKQSKYKPLST